MFWHPLDEVFGTPALVRVVRVLARHGGSLGVSDIAHRANLSMPTTRAALRRLVDVELVAAVAAGRTVVSTIRSEHPLTPALVALFNAEREQATEVLDAVRGAAAMLRPAPLAVWLYGSVARAEDAPKSDIDVLLVTAESRPTVQAEGLRDAIAQALPIWAHRISVVALGPNDVRRLAREHTDFWQALERDAIVLAGEAPRGVWERLTAGAA